MDLVVVASILSSNEEICIDWSICFSGEIGLNGEIRPIPRIDTHIAEAERIGFKKIVISKHNTRISKNFKIQIIECGKVMDFHLFLSKLWYNNYNREMVYFLYDFLVYLWANLYYGFK